MYHHKTYDHIVLALFEGDVTIEDVQAFSKDIDQLTQTLDDVYVISYTIHFKSYPSNLSQILRAVKLFQSALGKVKRLYGLQLNPMVTFLSNTITSIIGFKTNTIEARDRDHMFEIVRQDAETYPNLKASIHHLDSIQEYIDTYADTRQPEGQ